MAKDWEYCECGCHGFTLDRYWVYLDLKTHIFHLYKGHGFTFGQKIGEYNSIQECSNVVRNEITKEVIRLQEYLSECG